MSKIFHYGSDHLTTGICLDIATGKTRGIVDDAAEKRILASWRDVRKIVENHTPVYGINTGFGPLCDTRISDEDTSLLQTNLLKSHSVGVGEPIPQEIAKLMLITK